MRLVALLAGALLALAGCSAVPSEGDILDDRSIGLLASAGAAGCSIEDWNPATDRIDPIEVATARVGAAAEEARGLGVVLTARCENHLHGVDDLDDTIARLCAYRDAGAEVVYAPGLVAIAQIERVVGEGGFGTFKRDMEPAFAAPEMGWALMPTMHGKGYANEAVTAMRS